MSRPKKKRRAGSNARLSRSVIKSLEKHGALIPEDQRQIPPPPARWPVKLRQRPVVKRQPRNDGMLQVRVPKPHLERLAASGVDLPAMVRAFIADLAKNT